MGVVIPRARRATVFARGVRYGELRYERLDAGVAGDAVPARKRGCGDGAFTIDCSTGSPSMLSIWMSSLPSSEGKSTAGGDDMMMRQCAAVRDVKELYWLFRAGYLVTYYNVQPLVLTLQG